MLAAIVAFGMDLDPVDRLVREEHLRRVVVFRAGGVQRHPGIGNAANAVHVVPRAIEGGQLNDGHVAVNLLAERGDRGWQYTFEERAVERDAAADAGRDSGGPGRDARGQVNDAWRLAHASSVRAGPGQGNRDTRS